MRPVNVLLAEDEVIIRMVISQELQELGWKITEVGTADDGIGTVNEGNCFDLVITDINMPGERSGIDLAKAVRSANPETKIAIMTGLPLQDGAYHCDLYLSKPFSDIASVFQELMASAA